MNKDRLSESSEDDENIDPSSIPQPFAKRRFGQNFLVDKNVIDRVIAAVTPRSDETIIEIGPGRGALTSHLIEKSGRVVAIEFDHDLVPRLRSQFAGHANLKLIEADALTADFCEAIQPAQHARVLANLPYNVATAILQKLIEQRSCLTEITLILQKELVDRISAPPGSGERGFISVLVEAYYHAEILFDISPHSSRPAPKVWSSVVRLTRRPQPIGELVEEKLLWQVVSAGFAQRRKTILNNLRNAPPLLQEQLQKHGGASIILCEAGIPPLRRAETLTIEEWVSVAKALD